MTPERDFEQFVAAHGTGLLRLAVLLTGSRGDAEDLLQDALERAYRKWSRVQRADHPLAYVKQLLTRRAVDRRRVRRVQEVPLPSAYDAQSPEPAEATHVRDTLLRGLASLPPRQRAAVVLRHCEDLSEADVARLLDCSVGNVKSQTSRGLTRLRQLTGEELADALTGGTP